MSQIEMKMAANKQSTIMTRKTKIIPYPVAVSSLLFFWVPGTELRMTFVSLPA